MMRKIKIIMLIMCVIVMVTQVTTKANMVEYRGNPEGLIVTPDDFFLNMGELLPGDTKEDIAYIKNTTNDEIEVFFKTEPLNQSEYYDEIDYSLLEKIKLKISLKQTSSSEEQLLYEGNLGAELMSNYISLGKYKKGYDGEFLFKLEVPTDLRNNYTLSTTKVKWVFAVGNKINEDIPDKDTSDEDTSDEDVPDKDEKSNEIENENPITNIVNTIKTGDYIYYLIGILSLAVIICIIVIMINKKDE